MRACIFFLLSISSILTSCDFLADYYSDREIEKLREQGGFIETEKDRKLKEMVLDGIEPLRLDSFPMTLEDEIKNYVTKKHGGKTQYDFVVYYNTIIEYSPDTIGYLDTNHYAVNLKVYNADDTLETYLQYSKDFKLDFDFGH
jgi:hypothetical protein